MRQTIPLLAMLLFHSLLVDGFVSIRPNNSNTRSMANHRHVVLFSGALKQKPGESDLEFFKRIQKFAGDPIAFERMALGKEDVARDEKIDSPVSNEKKGGYQRAEDWDAQTKARQKAGEYTWDEKVQFEGQRFGNQVNQNEILKKILKGF